MLTGIKMAFLGGDARINEVIQQALDLDASVYLVGFDNLHLEMLDTLKTQITTEVISDLDAIILPLTGMSDDWTIQSQYSEQPITLTDEHFSALPKKCKIFTGIAQKLLIDVCRRHGLHLVKLMELDEVAILNSIPSAEGAIKMAMENTDITLHGSNTAVLGFGRCGVTIARMCKGIGANVMVGVRKEADLARIFEMGCTAFPLVQLPHALQEADIVFNTIPAQVITSEVLSRMKRSCVIIDIASRPGGTDFRFAEKRGIKALLAPSLPGIVAPKTAGQILAKSIFRLVLDHA
ncbi:dipicolinate synthase subunit DpsA [Effusibacillus dendaii]|uniref:Dipicolinate synthase subunit A n=1 Tax=Effusibacillus dendaii TaxID=2743772 RepID=A0A7I8D8H7_9BACL|nr:dipicolinate synthase subunit DpsA [Effusibacillus dendaii]BCJ85319.1 dipicolinate synthase subunit A [Effusibacillus dendaii]